MCWESGIFNGISGRPETLMDDGVVFDNARN